MRRRLILMRHAKSSWKTPGMTDHARPLNRRGQQDAPRMALELVRQGWTPRIVWLSDAQRTTETWRGMQPHIPDASSHREPTFYLAGLEAIRAVAAHWDDTESGPVLLLGHNPGWETAASLLSGASISMTTANAVLLEGHGETWSSALRGSWSAVAVLRPKELPLHP